MPTRMTEPQQAQHTRAQVQAVIAALDIAARRDDQPQMFAAFEDLDTITDYGSEFSQRGMRLALVNLTWAVAQSIWIKAEGAPATVRFWKQMSVELPYVVRSDAESDAVRSVVEAAAESTIVADFVRAMDYPGTKPPAALQAIMRACVALLRVGVPLHGDDPVFRWAYVTKMTQVALGLG